MQKQSKFSSRLILTLLLGALCFQACSKKTDSGGKNPDAAHLPSLEEQFEAFRKYIHALPALKPLPKNRAYVLDVLYVRDPNLPSPDNEEMKRLFALTGSYAKKYLGYRVRFRLKRVENIAAFFKRTKKRLEHPVLSYPARAWSINEQDPRFRSLVKDVIKKNLSGKSDEIVAKYFGERKGDKDAYYSAVTDQFLKKLAALYSEKDSRGRPLYDRKLNPERGRYVSYPLWSSIVFQEKEADFLLTNTVLACADTDMPLYVIKRGGVTSAFISNSEFRPLKGAGLMTLYPFLSQGAFFTKHRGKISRAEALNIAALIWTHELGHLLGRKSETYTLDGSIHQAPRGLDYVQWARRILKVNDSRSDSVPALTKY